MDTGGLGSADFKKYLAELAVGHHVDVSVELVDSAGNVLVSFDQDTGGGRPVSTIDGQVTMSGDGRMLTLDVSDPDRLLGVYEGLNWIGRMLRVTYIVFVRELAQSVGIRVFTGPVVTPTVRTADLVSFTAYGKEWYAKTHFDGPVTYPGGHLKTNVIKDLLATYCGEDPANIDVPDLPAKLAHPLKLDIEDTPFDAITQLANQVGRYWSYDGHGRTSFVRHTAKNPVYTFTGAKGGPGVVGPPPGVGTDWSGIKNAVQVTGAAHNELPAQKVQVRAPAGSPFFATKLGRNGAKYVQWDEVTLEHVYLKAALTQAAHQRLNDDLSAVRDMRLETIPMPVFGFGDYCRVEAPPDYVGNFSLTSFALPLKVDSDEKRMTIGWTGRVSAAAAARRS